MSEIMYDLAEGSDSGREWVEVYNESGTAVDLADWKLFENSTNHGLKALGASVLAPGAYAVIADNPDKFKNDHPSYAGLLFDSAFSLNNTGETLILRCCGKELSDVDTVVYSNEQGGAGDGASLSRSGSSWVSTDPTPGGPPGAARTASEPEQQLTPPPPPAQKLPEPTPQEEKSETEQITTSENVTPSPSLRVEETASQQAVEAPLPVAVQRRAASESRVTKEEVEDTEPEESELVADEQPVELVAAAAEPIPSDESWLWWAGAFGIGLVGAGGAYAMGRMHTREWDIEEIE
jgi:hypothetical protein